LLYHSFVVRGNRLDVLEFSAATYGFYYALNFFGAVGCFDHTVFEGEKAVKLTAARVNDLSKMFTNTGIKTIAAEWKVMKGKEYDLIVNDLGDKRNSDKARALIGEGVYNGRSYEQADDSPGARIRERVKKIAVNVQFKKSLRKGGTLVLKVLEPWYKSIAYAAYDIFRDFDDILMYKSPYSKPSSMEVFFVGVQYKCGVVNEDRFMTMIAEVSNSVLTRVTSSLTVVIKKGKETVNQVSDRAWLRHLRALDMKSEMKWVGPVIKPMNGVVPNTYNTLFGQYNPIISDEPDQSDDHEWVQ